MHRKTLKELTLKDNFMFGAVMSIEENCIRFLEMVLKFPIERVERSMIYHPEYSGIRLDIFARDEKNTRYNVEMQALNRPGIGKRARYYHSQIDMELLHSSMDYVGADLNESRKDFEDDYVRMLQTSVSRIKADRDMEENFMLLELLLRDERVDGRAEGRAEGMAEGMTKGKASSILEILQELGNVSEDLKNSILDETDTSTLTAWLKLAVKAESVEQFIEKM